VLNFLAKRKELNKLRNAFRTAKIFYERKYDGRPMRTYPHVLDVRVKTTKTEYVFRLPHGVNPEELQKKSYVFRSMFGEHLHFDGEHMVVMTVHKQVQNESFEYDYGELRESMSRYNLPIIAGKDVNGNMIMYDMVSNPHLLIAGETGSGKSVMLRSLLTSLIEHKRTGVRLHLADMKRSEFHLFRNVDIVESVMTKKADVIKCVGWFHSQLEVRGDLLDQHELSHVDELEEKVDYLILCIDEFSLLRDEKDTIEQLIDLAALGRALGIYVVLSTQRPDSKILDGRIKANLNVRYAFRHTNSTNSRITLGDSAEVDASKIPEDAKGKFYKGNTLLQSPYLTTDRAKEILNSYKVNWNAKPVYDPENTVEMPMFEEVLSYEQ
jgi:DNA segregation ATPase FtsK/SpoIIIE, S-DNA-T family